MFRVESRIDIRSSMASLPFYIKCSNRSNLIAIKCTNNMHLVANHVSLNLRYRTDSFLEWFELTSKIFEESIGDVVKIHVINRIGVNLCIIEIVITILKTTMEEGTQTRENQRRWLRINESKNDLQQPYRGDEIISYGLSGSFSKLEEEWALEKLS